MTFRVNHQLSTMTYGELRPCPVWNDGRPHQCACGALFSSVIEDYLRARLEEMETEIKRQGIAIEVIANEAENKEAELRSEVKRLREQLDLVVKQGKGEG